ncbi:MAG: hypothetical protein ACJA08_001069 [Cyclobacteriaceae bacterium]|jgi:hypothetical protein
MTTTKSLINLSSKAALLMALTLNLVSCTDDNDGAVSYDIPSTYEFTRDGASSVSYSGQTERLNMLAEMKVYVSKADGGEAIDAEVLLNMFANENSPFVDADLNASTKQIEDKTFISDVQFFKDLFQATETVSLEVSGNGTAADEGVAGKIERGTSGNFINVNEKGWEFTQFVEKGLMGALIYHQIFNVYLTDAKIGADIDNETIAEGNKYTTLEHHWDEAFGYWGVPVNFPNGDPVLSDESNRFWARYTNGRDELLDVNVPLMTAYITGRAAITANDHDTKNAQVAVIYALHELIAAATAIHYINDAIENLNSNDTGNLFHHLSEAYTFVMAIKYSPYASLTTTQITTILEENFGTDSNFWTVTIDGLNTAKSTLSNAYPELTDVADNL